MVTRLTLLDHRSPVDQSTGLLLVYNSVEGSLSFRSE